MFKTIRNAWKIPELRRRMLFTLLIIVIFRFGSAIPVPFLNTEALKGLMGEVSKAGTALSYLDMLSGGAFAYAALFAMGPTPYINSSIIIELLTVAIPALERMAKEGEEGRKKLGTITRYVAVGLALAQAVAYYFYLRNNSYGGVPIVKYTTGWQSVFAAFVIILTFTAGAALIMWLGEQVNQHGVGNGISIILFAGIVSRMPHVLNTLGAFWQAANQDPSSYGKYYFLVPLFAVLFLLMMWVIVFMYDSERRIPVQYAKRVVGRRMYGGQSTHIPIKVGLSGVMPIIFASSILIIPTTIKFFLGERASTGFWASFFDAFSPTGWLYSVLYFILIILFAFFYMTIQYNPVEMANNLRQSNGTIPGIRPGKPTSDYIMKVLSKVTFIGSLFLAFIALMPIIFSVSTGMGSLSIGGTSLLILVGVALETVKQLESQMMMRHYKGFLD
ncbi:MAG TPA: preprotein translocase subunit SecY [Ruminococcaceae bacterium]|nr:preprotein translocase subunit SecY [Oscillospiraceae bacterium]HBT90407.1 preprotein translocase subunit SecY [Oscillospiraceae bacterium]HCB91039.1 preprotein translocase subunit SecY [Oscillospiraceae bacterium]